MFIVPLKRLCPIRMRDKNSLMSEEVLVILVVDVNGSGERIVGIISVLGIKQP